MTQTDLDAITPFDSTSTLPAFPMARTCPFSAPAQYASMRDQEPVTLVQVPTGQQAWLVTRHEDVRRLLVDPRVSSDRHHPQHPMTEDVTPTTRANIANAGTSLIGLDSPEHNARRRMLVPEFTLRRAQAMRQHIQETVDRCVDDLLAGPKPANIVTELAEIVPGRTLTELLGMPYQDRDLIERTATAMLRQNVAAQERQRAGMEMRTYVDSLITQRSAAPTDDDLLGRLILRNQQLALYDHNQLIGLTMLLLIAGFETTVNMITLGVVGILQQPQSAAAIAAGGEATSAAVEELLRSFTVVDALTRVTTADIEVAGTVIPANSGLLLSLVSANRDTAAFTDPDRMVFDRSERGQLAFGFGIHQCIGQNLARAELEIVFSTLFSRIPSLRLATPLDEIPFKYDSNIFGADQVLVTWDDDE